MKNLVLIVLSACFILTNVYSQPALEITFTAVDGTANVQLDSINVMNLTQESDTVLFWPDTVLVLNGQAGIPEFNKNINTLQVFQNHPNPVIDKTTLTLYVPAKGKVKLVLTDILGRQVFSKENILNRGYHSFRLAPGCGKVFFFTAYWKGKSSSIKIVNANSFNRKVQSIEYLGNDVADPQFKIMNSIQGFGFNPGDELLYIGYVNQQQSGIPDIPIISNTYSFQFANNIPCPGTPTVNHGGQVYNTVQIFSQCWLKGNLNIGTMIQGDQDMTDNGIIEKKCYGNLELNCNEYGGLYQWDEMMQYTSIQGAQGICPPGWHIATDGEWKILEGSVDSLYGIGHVIWDEDNDNRGFDAGFNLKATTGWDNNGNGNDTYGFTGLPGGSCYLEGYFAGVFNSGTWWTATEYFSDNAWSRSMSDLSSSVNRSSLPYKAYGFSVRCLMD